ncbi:hypothetical protein B4Q13_24660 [Lacticaseibacillus rhamnosus]
MRPRTAVRAPVLAHRSEVPVIPTKPGRRRPSIRMLVGAVALIGYIVGLHTAGPAPAQRTSPACPPLSRGQSCRPQRAQGSQPKACS